MLGEMSESPRVAARIASPSISGPASLNRNPVAPAWSAPCTYSSRSKVVITTTAIGSSTVGPASCRVASTPSRTGIRMSIRQTSGRSSRASRTASCPSRASPTTSMPSRVPRISRSPVRTRSWSSATSTRIVTRSPAGAGSRRPPAAAGVRAGAAGATEQGRSLDHPDDAEARPRGGPALTRVSVVADVQAAPMTAPPVDAHVDQRRVPGMAQGVGDGLLGDPEHGRVHRRLRGSRGHRRASPRRGVPLSASPRRAAPGRQRRAAGRSRLAPGCAAPAPSRASRRACVTPPPRSPPGPRAASAGRVAASARPAWAWIAIAETWWATVSCSSRASSTRSSAFTCSSRRSPGAVLRARGDAERHRAHQHGRPADRVSDPGPADEDPGRGRDQDDREPCQPPRARSPTGTARTAAPGSRSSCTCRGPGRRR